MRKRHLDNLIFQGLYDGHPCTCKIEWINGDYVVYDVAGNGSAVASLSDKQMLELLLTGELKYGKITLFSKITFT
jgi:hypothetical protein